MQSSSAVFCKQGNRKRVNQGSQTRGRQPAGRMRHATYVYLLLKYNFITFYCIITCGPQAPVLEIARPSMCFEFETPAVNQDYQDPSKLLTVSHNGWPSAEEKSKCLKIPPHVP